MSEVDDYFSREDRFHFGFNKTVDQQMQGKLMYQQKLIAEQNHKQQLQLSKQQHDQAMAQANFHHQQQIEQIRANHKSEMRKANYSIIIALFTFGVAFLTLIITLK